MKLFLTPLDKERLLKKEKELIDTFCEDLNGYLKERFKYKRNQARNNFYTIDVSTKKVDLYIRFNSIKWGKTNKITLVLARIGFKRTRKAEGTNLLKFLLEKQPKYGYEEIGIEQCNENAVAFANKLNFRPIDEGNENFVIGVNDLREALSEF